MPTDPLKGIAQALARQFRQLDTLGLHGDARRIAVRRALTIARERGTTIPVVMGEAMAHWAATGRVPTWLTEEVPNA